MTRVYLEQKGNRFTVSCQGHATGNQDVCAAASCLIYTLVGWLRNASVLVQEERLEEDADALLQFCGGNNAETAFDVICTGFLQLGNAYPQHISVILNII